MPERSKKAVAAVVVGIIGNLLLALIKFIAGLWGNSYALIADAIESSSDTVASIFTVVGIKYISKPADDDHPYGHGRAEPLFTFLLVIFLLASAGIISYHAIENIITPHALPKAFTLVVLGFVIVIKEIFHRYLTSTSHDTDSSVLKAEAAHHRSDAITSLAAFIGISIAIVGGEKFASADDWAALLAAGVIIFNSYRLFRQALGEIMDEHLYDDLIEEIRAISTQVSGINGTEKCFVRKIGLNYHVDLHAKVDANISVKEGHQLAHNLKDELLKHLPQIADVLIHIEPYSR